MPVLTRFSDSLVSTSRFTTGTGRPAFFSGRAFDAALLFFLSSITMPSAIEAGRYHVHVEPASNVFAENDRCKRDRMPMGITARVLFPLLTAGAFMTACSRHEPARPTAAIHEAPAEKWLSQHAVRLRTTSLEDGDQSDLEALRTIVGDARIVQLGEESHGDGTAFLTKARLVRFLHEKMGFNVIAFESPLFDCSVAWERLLAGADVTEIARQCMYTIWSESEQVQPLLRYIASNSKTSAPLELTGFDCQLRKPNEGTRTTMAIDLRAYLDRAGRSREVAPEFWASLDQTLSKARDRKYKATTEEYRKAIALFEKAEAYVADLPDSGPRSSERSSFWRRAIQTTRAFVEYKWNPENLYNRPPDAGAKDDPSFTNNPRDAEMAKNLIWLARNRYPNAKIITWGASFHFAREVASIDLREADYTYDRLTPMGQLVRNEFGDQMFSFAFIADHGAVHYMDTGESEDVKKAPPDSIEDRLAHAGLDTAIVDLRHLGPDGAWLRDFQLSRPLGYDPMRAQWPKVFDGFVFNRVMAPVRGVDAKASSDRDAGGATPE
jgi:erythromycin esterase